MIAKLKAFYKQHRDAIWRYGSACALVAAGWLLDYEWMVALVVLGLLPRPNESHWQVDVTRDDETTTHHFDDYDSYRDFLDSLDPGNPASEPSLPFFPGAGLNFANITEAAQNSLQTFLREVPGAQDFMRFYLPHIQSMMEAQPEAYPMGFDLGAGKNEQQLMRMQMERLGQIPDLASAYEGAFDAYLPMLEREYSKSVEETEGRLEALGLSGSSPGLEILSDKGSQYAAQVAGLRKDIDIQRAQAKTQMFNLEGTQLGAAWDMSGREAQRSYDTQRMEYADWLRQTGQQAELASLLGTPTYNAMLGSMSNVFNTGQSAAAGLQGQSMASQTALAGQQYAAQMGLYSQQLEQQFMAPYLEMASQPVQISSGGGGCC